MATQKLLHIRGRTTAGDVIISPHGEPAVATVYFQRGRDGSPTYDAEANARLFIASPLMLEALEAAYALYNEQLRILCGSGFDVPEKNAEVGRLLQAAIAAARGTGEESNALE